MAEVRICGQCGFYKPDNLLDWMGHCAITGKLRFGEEICEAEKGAAKDGGIPGRQE
jgi:hypothetical protein